MIENFKSITENLRDYLFTLKQIYEESEKPDKNDAEFFESVRQEINPYYDLIDEWEVAAKELIKERKITIFPPQVDATVKSMRAIALHSYYIDVRKRRYMDIKKSCDYVFQLILKELS